MATGIIPIDKPEGWTSQDVASKLRGVFKTKRVGHGGTLDPMATGVLPVFVGRATRAVEFFEHATKEYIATLRLGVLTDTEDITGTVLEQRPVKVTAQDVEAALEHFRGRQMQVPPMYSAVKIGGQKLYELARKGQTVERQPREIEIFTLELLDSRKTEYDLRVICSKGTYIRTLCKDIGIYLGCGGTMAALRRSRAGDYTIEKAVPLGQLLDMAQRGENVEKLLLPIDSMFMSHPSLSLTPNQQKVCRNGGSFSVSLPEGTYRLYGGEEFLALGKCHNGVMSNIKSFFEVN